MIDHELTQAAKIREDESSVFEWYIPRQIQFTSSYTTSCNYIVFTYAGSKFLCTLARGISHLVASF